MDEIAIMVVLEPMLIAIATKFGIDPIHFGAIIVTNVAIGMAAPPIGNGAIRSTPSSTVLSSPWTAASRRSMASADIVFRRYGRCAPLRKWR
jgi:hypothetical protein